MPQRRPPVARTTPPRPTTELKRAARIQGKAASHGDLASSRRQHSDHSRDCATFDGPTSSHRASATEKGSVAWRNAGPAAPAKNEIVTAGLRITSVTPRRTGHRRRGCDSSGCLAWPDTSCGILRRLRCPGGVVLMMRSGGELGGLETPDHSRPAGSYSAYAPADGRGRGILAGAGVPLRKPDRTPPPVGTRQSPRRHWKGHCWKGSRSAALLRGFSAPFPPH
jgi:hypothetical protein